MMYKKNVYKESKRGWVRKDDEKRDVEAAVDLCTYGQCY